MVWNLPLVFPVMNGAKHKVKLALHKHTDTQVLQLGQNLLTGITGNPHFPNPWPSLAEFAAQLSATKSRVEAFFEAETAYKTALGERRASMEQLSEAITRLAFYVETISGGDEAIIHSAGLPVRARRAPVTMPQVVGLQVVPSLKEGELLARWKRVPGVRVYRVQVCFDADARTGQWVDKLTSTKTKCALNHDLVSGHKVWVRVCAVGARNKGAWSNPVVKMVP